MIADPPTDLPTVRILEDVAEWDRVASDWAALFDASPEAATPLQFAWLRGWWRIYGPIYGANGGARGLRLFTFWRGSRLVGALPLYENRVGGHFFGLRRIAFLSTGEAEYEETCPDYMNLLAAPGEGSACVAALEAALHAAEWDCFELLGIPEHSPLLSARIVIDPGQRRSVIPRGACPIANMEGGFEAYLQRLSPNSRQRARRLLREVEKCGAILELATTPVMEQFFDDLVRLHQERWMDQGKPGCFAASRFTAFHRSLAYQWIGSGQVVLARLSLDGQTMAALYGFVTRLKFDFYQSGVKTIQHGPLRSPGHVAHLLLMRELCGRGITRYDFLRGSSNYKTQLATESVQLFMLQVWRLTGRATAYHAARIVGKAVRDALPTGIRRRLGAG
jgi:CelD/BcsL family acetyltransferase involved in cellulose biosynthesis